MKGTFEGYDAYKDSGVEWLKELPSQWLYFRVKEVCEVKGRIGFRGYNKDDLVNKGEGALLIGASEMHFNGYIKINNPKFISWFKYYESPEIILCPGDLVIAQRGSTIGKSALIPDDIGKATINPTLVLLKYIKRVNKKYLLYFLMSPSLQNFISSQIASTAIPMISQQQIGNYVIFCPPDLEQKAIAAYLDTKTAQIDCKIELLTQKATQYGKLKQSLINETVTRGLDKTMAMKDSGVEWIGEVPKHWEIKRVKDELENLDYKRMPLSGEVRGQMTEQVFDYYGASGVIDKVESYIFDEPLILIGEDGANLLMRNSPLAFIARGKYWVNNHAHILRPKKGSLHFLCYLLEAFDYTILISGSAQPKLTAGNLNSVLLMIPPISEQQAIADYLDTKTAHIDNIVTTINTQIDKLKELRKILINDVVTGKIKVS